MPCSDSSSHITLRLDQEERFVSFDFAKITCDREITSRTGYSAYCKGRTLREILDISYSAAIADLELVTEEKRFILCLEQEALRAGIAQYLGIEDTAVDRDRCPIISIDTTNDGVTIAMRILPPKEMPQVTPCQFADTP